MKKNTQNPAPRKFELLSDEEDRAITLAAMSDPDNQPWTDEEFAKIKKILQIWRCDAEGFRSSIEVNQALQN